MMWLDFEIRNPTLKGLQLTWLRPEKVDSHTFAFGSEDNHSPRLESCSVLPDAKLEHGVLVKRVRQANITAVCADF